MAQFGMLILFTQNLLVVKRNECSYTKIKKEGTNVRVHILKSVELNQIVEMIYMKNNGEISKRKIKVISVSKDSFKAYCFLRCTKRTFKIENVLAFVPVLHKERAVI